MVTDPLAPLPDALIQNNCPRLILSHLTGLNPSINCAAGTRISKTVREVAVELRETRPDKKRVRDQKENKGAAD